MVDITYRSGPAHKRLLENLNIDGPKTQSIDVFEKCFEGDRKDEGWGVCLNVYETQDKPDGGFDSREFNLMLTKEQAIEIAKQLIEEAKEAFHSTVFNGFHNA